MRLQSGQTAAIVGVVVWAMPELATAQVNNVYASVSGSTPRPADRLPRHRGAATSRSGVACQPNAWPNPAGSSMAVSDFHSSTPLDERDPADGACSCQDKTFGQRLPDDASASCSQGSPPLSLTFLRPPTTIRLGRRAAMPHRAYSVQRTFSTPGRPGCARGTVAV